MARSNYVHGVAFGALAVVAWSSTSWQTHETLDHPVPSIIFALLLCAAILRLAERYLPRDFDSSMKWEPQNIPVSLGDESTEEIEPQELTTQRLSLPSPLDPRTRRRVFLVVVGCIVLRVETLRRIGQQIECTTKNLESILLPLFVVVYEFVALENNQDVRGEDEIMWADFFMDIYLNFTPFRARFLMPTFLLCLGIYLVSAGHLPSTYVCPSEAGLAYSLIGSQITGAVLDFVIIIGTWRTLSETNSDKRKLGTFAAIMLYSAAMVSLMSIPHLISSSIGLSPTSIRPTVTDGTALALVLICFMYFISEIRPLVLVNVFIFVWLYTPLIQGTRTGFRPFPPRSKTGECVGLFLMFIGFTTFMHISTNAERSVASRNFAKRFPIWFNVLLTLSLLVAEVIYLLASPAAGFHPISVLVYNARIEGDRWLVHASSSISLETAVAEYHSRYRGRAPPPNFDKWYEFAMERGCPVKDNYDQIDRDLLPFWAVSPSTIRQRSPLQLPGNDVFAISIRDGRVEVSPLSTADLKWEPNETIKSIEKFAQWLPDMYIAFNLREEPRVAVPWKEIDRLTKKASTVDVTLVAEKDHNFTPNRGTDSSWPSIEYDHATSVTYKEQIRKMHTSSVVPSFPSVFQWRAARTCPSGSPTGRSRAWHVQGLCYSCAYPHSLGQFVHDWTSAGDFCHQPDMANLDGFLMSPGTAPEAGFSPDELLPMFSRSKVSGYNDILFPGPWDYVDSQDPVPLNKIFSELSNTLVWRGEPLYPSTSQAWRGHIPQRLAHLANRVNSTALIPMLLPASDTENFIYENIPARELSGLLDLNVALMECETCKSKEYLDQQREIGTKPGMNEMDTLQHRYLFVPGGPDESRRLMRYLPSNSVPFRSSIFRYWYDDRLTPWLHYVPIDGRLQAVYSTLAYFAGLKGKINGREIDMQPRFSDALFIAEQGRKWAEKALRREDSEAYLFRLLLEYGRVVDDRRDEIGFQLET